MSGFFGLAGVCSIDVGETAVHVKVRRVFVWSKCGLLILGWFLFFICCMGLAFFFFF